MFGKKASKRVRLFYFPRMHEQESGFALRLLYETFQKIEQELLGRIAEFERMEKYHHFLRCEETCFARTERAAHIIGRSLVLEIKNEKFRLRIFLGEGFLKNAPPFIDAKHVFAVYK